MFFKDHQPTTGEGHESWATWLNVGQEHVDVDLHISEMVTNGDVGRAGTVRLWFGCLSLGQGTNGCRPRQGKLATENRKRKLGSVSFVWKALLLWSWDGFFFDGSIDKQDSAAIVAIVII